MSCDIRAMWELVGGKTPAHWSFTTLEKLLETPKSVSVGVMYPGADTKGGVPLIRVSDVKNGALVGKPDFCISAEVDEEYKRTRLNGTELLITLVGNPGDCILVTEEMKDWNAARALAVVRLKNLELREWLRYVLLSKPAKHIIDARLNTTVQKTLNLKDVKELPIPLPPESERDLITKNIRDIEKKRVINSQTNQTLEQMAQAIFKSWFVDFDPVKAKMNGKQPEGMDTVTASLFPEKLVESELGLIPDGWNAVQVGDIVQRLKPKKRYTKKQVEPYGKTPVYEQGASILLGFHNDDAGFEASPEAPVFIFGDHTCITHLSCSKFDISSNVIPLQGSVRPTIWTYYAIQGKQEFQEYRRHWSEFIIKDVVLPPVELAEKYAELVTTKYLMMESLKRQSKELEQLRDTLLPKLLSGEIELSKVEALNE